MKNILFVFLLSISLSGHAQKLSDIKQIWSNSGIPTIDEMCEWNDMKVWLIRLPVNDTDEADFYIENEKFIEGAQSPDYLIQLFLFTDNENNYLDHLLLETGKLIHHIKPYNNELYAVERNGLFAGQRLEKVVKWDENLNKSDVFEFENNDWKISINDYIYDDGEITIMGSFNGDHIAIYNDSLFNDYTDPIITNPAVERTGYIYKLNLISEQVIFKSNFGTRQFADPVRLFEDDAGNYYCVGKYSYGDLNMQGQSINWEGFNSQEDIFCFKLDEFGDLAYLTGISTEGYILIDEVEFSQDGELTLALFSSNSYLVINDILTLENNSSNQYLVNLDYQGSYNWHSQMGSDLRVTAIKQEEDELKVFGNTITSTGLLPFTYNEQVLAQYEKLSAFIFEINSSSGNLNDHWLVDQENNYEILNYKQYNDQEKIAVKFRQEFIDVDDYQNPKYSSYNQINAIATFDSKLVLSVHNLDQTQLIISPTILSDNMIINIENVNNSEVMTYEIYNNMGMKLAQGTIYDNQIQISNLKEDGLKYLLLKKNNKQFFNKFLYLKH